MYESQSNFIQRCHLSGGSPLSFTSIRLHNNKRCAKRHLHVAPRQTV